MEPQIDYAFGRSCQFFNKGRFHVEAGNIKILFVAGFGPIVRDTGESRKLYEGVLGIPFKEENGSYLHTESLQGARTFALWPLSQAAQSCFGKDTWPDGIPAPQAWLEFDVDDVEEATRDLEARRERAVFMSLERQIAQSPGRVLPGERA